MTCIATAPVSRRRAVAPPLQAALAWQVAPSSSGVPSRPVLFTKDDNSVSVASTYDYMGRRATKKVTVNGSVTLHQRFLYRGYLQIACCDLTRSNHPCLWLITWDPNQPVATRPLAIPKDSTWYTYGWDLTKNICEVYGQHGYIYYQKEGETSFYRAALTLEREIKNRNTFNEKCDTVRLITIRFVDDFNKEWERLKELSESVEQSKIQELHILTHSGKGEIYLNGFSLSSYDISDLEKLNWTNNNSEIVLHGCNSGLCDSSGESVAGASHDSLQVTAIGQSGYAQFSESENSRMPWDRIDNESEDVYLWSYGDGGRDFTYGFKREPIIYK